MSKPKRLGLNLSANDEQLERHDAVLRIAAIAVLSSPGFQASVAALRSRTSSGHEFCPSACTPSPTMAIIVRAGSAFSVIGYPRRRSCLNTVMLYPSDWT